MKVAPLMRAFIASPAIQPRLVHTGQHYDQDMSGSFFDELGIEAPAFHLNSGSASHAVQTARILTAFEDLCQSENPDLVIVVGDVNSTIACALAAKKLFIPVAHVEAGLRSDDHSMPEEINRLATDAISDLFFVTEKSGEANLLREGHDPTRIHLVGNLMIDNLHHQLGLLEQVAVPTPHPDLPVGSYGVMTLHRPSNVDSPETLGPLLQAVSDIGRELPVVFAVHPRTAARIAEFGFGGLFHEGFRCLPPQSYQAFLNLWTKAKLVLTDSGGIQEETTALGVPCFTLRDNTERPITVEEGSNLLVGSDPQSLRGAFARFKAGEVKRGKVPALWDGRTAQRITAVLEDYLASRAAARP